MKRTLCAIVFVFLLAGSAAAEVLISQVYPNPVATESGGEAVELWNTGASSINLSGWKVRTETSVADATLPALVVAPGSRVLVADANWNASRDNASWPLADYEEALTLANTDGGLALVDAAGAIQDAVGWGNPDGIADGLFEGTPASNPPEGRALVRQSSMDTDDNAADFAVGPFSPAGSSPSGPDQPPTREILVTLTVQGGLPVIAGITIQDDDPLQAGVQIVPVPGDVALVNVSALLEDPNGLADLVDVRLSLNGQDTSLTLAEAMNATRGRFEGLSTLRYYDLPGNYTGALSVMDASGQQVFESLSIEYMSALGLSVPETLDLTAGPGEAASAMLAAQNLGNVPFTLAAAGTPLAGASRLDPGVLALGVDANALSPLTLHPQVLAHMPVGAAAFQDLFVRVSVPQGTPVGAYAGTIQLYATPT